MRALFLVLDHLGVGHSSGEGTVEPGALGRIFKETPELELPTLFSLGLGEIVKGRVFDPPARHTDASYGRMIQRSAGADALSGLWELAGVVSGCPFTTANQLPKDCLAPLARECGVELLLNPTSDSAILFETSASSEIEELRDSHLQTGKPIATFCADSALHIAAHESTASFARLMQIGRRARNLCDTWHIAQVTVQLVTGNPRAWKPACPEFSLFMVPPRTLLNTIADKGFPVEAIGGIHDAFAGSGVTRSHFTGSLHESLRVIRQLWDSPQNGMVFANLKICPDLSRGEVAAHAISEAAQKLAHFDAWLEHFLKDVDSDNLLIITGSNGGGLAPDSPRQELPVLIRYGGRNAPLGIRHTCADVAATLGSFFEINENGRPWLIGEPLITFHRAR